MNLEVIPRKANALYCPVVGTLGFTHVTDRATSFLLHYLTGLMIFSTKFTSFPFRFILLSRKHRRRLFPDLQVIKTHTGGLQTQDRLDFVHSLVPLRFAIVCSYANDPNSLWWTSCPFLGCTAGCVFIKHPEPLQSTSCHRALDRRRSPRKREAFVRSGTIAAPVLNRLG